VQNIDEKRAVEQVCEWLTARFPDMALATVRLEVERAHSRFDGCPVRHYVPVLVERLARDRLVTMSVSALNTVASS
jgi:hypothetical protein